LKHLWTSRAASAGRFCMVVGSRGIVKQGIASG
jgi:hypothetical protein